MSRAVRRPEPFAALGAALLFGALFMRWYGLDPTADLRFPDSMPYLDIWPTAWRIFPVTAAALAGLAVLAAWFRAAAAVAAVLIVIRIAFPPADYLDPSVGAGLALTGALLAAVAPSGANAIARLGGLALLASLFAPWYTAGVFIITRGANHTETRSSLGGNDLTAWQAFSFVDLALAAVALVALVRPSYARVGGAVAIVLVIVRLVNAPFDLDLGYGGWIALAGSILAWAGGLAARRPKITDQCSPATRSSTSPASPASS